MGLQQEFTLIERSEQYKLPHLRLRELGLRNVPAVPVDLGGMLDTLLKLGLRAKQREQAYQALTKTFTIGGTTARAYTFLFGGQSADAQPAAAREQAQAFLSNAPALSPSHLAATLEKQDEALAHSSNETAGDPLTMLPLEDPKQSSLSWTTFPSVYAVGEENLDEWAETLDVTRPEKATEDAAIPGVADAALLCATHDILRTPRALEHVLRHVRPGGQIVAGGPKLVPRWRPDRIAMDLFTFQANRDYVTTFEGFDRPWSHLGRLIPNLKVRDVLFGAGYIATGTRPANLG
jgi:hypothetical protein